MLDIVQKRKVRSLMYNWVTIGVLAVVVLFILHSTWSVYSKKVESMEMKRMAEERVYELRFRDKELASKIERLNTDSGIEEEIRSKFSVAKENEAMVVVVLDEETQASTTSAEKGFWSSLKGLFGMGD